MANDLTLSVTLTGDGRQLTGTLRNAQGEVREFGGITEREGGRATRALDSTGRQAQTVTGHLNTMRTMALGAMTALVGMAGGFSLRRVIGETAEFQDSILGLQAVSGATVGQIAQLEQQARSLGATSMHSAKQAADAQRFLAQAGFDVNEVLAATPGVLNLATAGQMDLAQAADIASNVLGGMRMEVDQLNRVNDVLAETSARSNTNITQLGEAFSFAGPFAASASISIETTSAAIGVLSDAGLQASRAGTGLIGIIRQLSNVTPQAAGVLADYGLTVEDVNIEAHGLETVLERIRDANMSTADAFAIFGSEAGAAAQILAAGAGRVREFTTELENAEGATSRMAQIIGSGLTGSIRGFNSMLSESILQLGEGGIGGAFELVIDNATGVLAAYNGMLPALAEANDLTDEQVRRIEMLVSGVDLLKDALIVTTGIMAGRYVGAIAASQTALTAKSAIAATTTGTLNLLTGATSRQTVANNVMAASARGAAGAIALVGGPAGAAVIAVGALYYFREELGLVDVAAQDATNALDANSDAIRDGTAAAMDASYDNLISSLEAVSLQAQEAMAQLVELEARQAFYENSHQGVADSLNGAIGDQAQVLEGLWERQVKLRTAIKENRAARESATRADSTATAVMNEMTVTADALTESTARQTVTTREAAKEVTTLAASYEDLLDRLNPNRRAARQYAQDLGVLNLAFATGRMSAVQYMQAMGLLHESFQEAQRESEELATTVGAEADRMATLWTRQLERMDDASVDMWRSFLDGSEDAFGSFRRLALDTLAEVIHAFTTRQITASFGVNANGGGMPGAAPGGGFGISPGSISNAWNAVQNGFGNIQWSGAGGAQAYGGSGWLSAANTQTGLWGGSMQNFSGMQGLAGAGAGFAGSYAGTKIGESLFGKKAGSSYGATGGALVGTYFGGPLGAAIGGAIGGALDAAFGSGKSDPRLNISTYGDRSSFSHDSVATGAFGTVGFGKGTRRSDELFGGIPEEREFLAALAASDDLLASLARSPEELNKMASAVQGVHLSASGVDGIMEQLSNRTVAAVSALDGDFGAFVASLGTDVETIVARTQNAVAALNVMGAASERLNLQFDTSAQGALRAADNIAQFAGGVEQLNQLQNSYYQAYFSDAERAANLQRDLTQTLGQMGYTLPATHEGFRALVEQQDRMTESGQRQYVQLLQLAGGFDELQTMLARTGETASVTTGALRSAQDIARERERLERQVLTLEGNILELRRRDLDALDESNRPLQRHVWALQDEADAAKAAERAVADVSREVERSFSTLMGGVQNAYKALTQSISNEQAILRSAYDETTQRINANISTIQDAISASVRTARSLTSTLDTMMQRELGQAESRREAQSYLQSVLASGGLGDPAMLDKALTAVAEPSAGLYGSFESYQRDFWTTANVIDQLNDRADGQLTTEQRSLAALERQLVTAERQFNSEMSRLDNLLAAETAQLEAIFGQQTWLETINGSVLSLSDALAALGVSSRTAAPRSNAQVKEAAGHIASTTTGGWNEKDSAIGWAAINAGVTSAQLAASIGKSQQYVLDRAQQLGLPKFRDGGIASGPDSGYPVELHGTEAVIPLKNGPIPLQITGGGDAELLREIRRLNDRIARLEVELKEGNSISRGIADHTSKAAREVERQRHERQQEALA
ncbi:phage tail tape measure protein [Halomonas sp. PAMB 3232]|uniref:phage tail tape measure protein n=1 Tax=Halomonas sp. PAMB 3232 TaxID=3075221 RepID=UPI00289B4397|nr:phage tail tape measure protein [Halomonas sp. PAMB 3232]WNL39820.1 phage tail tape measure protein [Halomonas sp. PAMB 3232]